MDILKFTKTDLVNAQEDLDKYRYCYEYPRAGITTDCIIIHNIQPTWKRLLLIKRKFKPFANHLAIPGGFVNVKDETIIEACKREVKEETNLEVNPVFFTYADKINRDPRSRTISFIFSSVVNNNEIYNLKAGDDAADFVWIDFDYDTILNTKLAFDHKEILLKFLSSC